MGAIPRLVLTLVCAVAVGLVLSLIGPATLAQSDQPLVVVAKMDGPITPVMARYASVARIHGRRTAGQRTRDRDEHARRPLLGDGRHH